MHRKSTRPPNFLRLLGLGIVVVGVQVALGAVVSAEFDPVPGVFLVFALGVPIGLWLTRACRRLAFPAIALFALSGVYPALVVAVPLWGRTTDSPADPAAAGFAASGWTIRAEYAVEEPLIAGRRNKTYGHRRIAPLVRDGWTPEQPVDVWVAAETRLSGQVLPWHPAGWSKPDGEYARLTGEKTPGARLAAGRAAKAFGLRTSERPLVVLRVDSLAAVQAEQYRQLGCGGLVASGVWAAIVGLAALLARWRNRGQPCRTRAVPVRDFAHTGER